jgi:hypothetical protein
METLPSSRREAGEGGAMAVETDMGNSLHETSGKLENTNEREYWRGRGVASRLGTWKGDDSTGDWHGVVPIIVATDE